MNHSPAPWTLKEVATGHYEIYDASGRIVVTVSQGDDDDQHAEADARLISQAPELWDWMQGVMPLLASIMGPERTRQAHRDFDLRMAVEDAMREIGD